jgi:transcriptional regulator with XRE-family HTH domain
MTLIRTVDDLIEALRSARLERDISQETLTDIAGLPARYANKIEARTRGLGTLSLPSLLGALGKALVLVDDTAAIERVRGRWVRRKRRGNSEAASEEKLMGDSPEPGN